MFGQANKGNSISCTIECVLARAAHPLRKCSSHWRYNLYYFFVSSGKPICSILVPLKEQSVIVYRHRYVYNLSTTTFVVVLMSANSLLTSFKVSPASSSDHCSEFRIRRCSSFFLRLWFALCPQGCTVWQWHVLWVDKCDNCLSDSPMCGGSHAELSLWRLCCLLCGREPHRPLRALFWCNNTLTPIKSIRFLSKLI